MDQKISQRNIGIDILRGMSTVYIVGFWHMGDYTRAIPGYKNILTTRFTWVILGIYVLISGYFLGSKKLSLSKESILYFYKRRLIRVYPLYLIAVILFTVFHLSDIQVSIKAVFVISMFLQPTPLTLWFITMIIVFYIASPLIIVGCQRKSISGLILGCSLICIIMMIYAHNTKLLDIRILLFFPVFVLGVLAANKKTYFLEKKYILIILFILSVCISFIKIPSNEFNSLRYILLITFGSYLFFSIFKEIPALSGKAYTIFYSLSYSSYCMYLFHRLFYMHLTRLYFPESPYLQVLYLVMFCLPCIIICSFFIQKAYDFSVKLLLKKL